MVGGTPAAVLLKRLVPWRGLGEESEREGAASASHRTTAGTSEPTRSARVRLISECALVEGTANVRFKGRER